MDRHSIAADGLTATIAADGAELVSPHAQGGPELIWQGGPPGRTTHRSCSPSSAGCVTARYGTTDAATA